MLGFKRITRGIKRLSCAIFFDKLFPLWQSLGFHLIRNHYYEPVPDTRTLKDELWQQHSRLIGFEINEERQLELLSEFISKFKSEYDKLPLNRDQILKPYEYYINNTSFGSVDGEILYCMIRYFRPKKIFEIGSGNSTLLSARAVLKNKENAGEECVLIGFEPYPSDVIKAGFPGLFKLMPDKVQDIPLSEFKKLKDDDILFIDSTHILKIGSDVKYEYLEILPSLNKGVIIHIHDIFLPAEYPKDWVLKKHIFWNEQYLLQAFLTFNDTFEVLWAASYMHLKNADKLEEAFGSYKRDKIWPGSFWIRKIK